VQAITDDSVKIVDIHIGANKAKNQLISFKFLFKIKKFMKILIILISIN